MIRFLAPVVLLLGAPQERYLDEETYDTRVLPDEAVSNLALANHRWPDCSTNRAAIADIFRIEGAKTDPEKALALWKWFRILVSGTGGGYIHESDRMVQDPHKIFTVYGHHQCDGLSWSMTALWRAAGYVAFDECDTGHTIASLRYRDDDGLSRFPDFDPQRKIYHWDPAHNRVATATLPLNRGVVPRHLTAPLQVHTLRSSLRAGETVERLWKTEGHVLAAGPMPKEIDLSKDPYYGTRPGHEDGIAACAGTEVQTFTAVLTREERIFRLPSPYVAVEAVCEASFSGAGRLLLSRDGETWAPIFTKESAGEEKVAIDLGRKARAADRPHVYSAYTFFIKAEGAGLQALKVTAWRELNKRTLPNLMPGENVLRLSADRIAPGLAVELDLSYRLNGQLIRVLQRTSRFPHYFRIAVPEGTRRVLKLYDRDFDSGDALRMEALRFRLVPAGAGEDASIDGEARFREACPHPADLTARKDVEQPAADLMQVSGFFPQSRAISTDKARLARIQEDYRTGKTEDRWRALEDMGGYPELLDFLCQALPKATNDESLFIVKALGQIGDRKAVPALLERWNQGPPARTPGARHIPDVLASLGEKAAVPALVGRLKGCRFDLRFHVAHALGILGGREAEAALRDLVANDPFPAVREEARDALRRLGRDP